MRILEIIGDGDHGWLPERGMGGIDEVEEAILVFFVLIELSETHRISNNGVLIGH